MLRARSLILLLFLASLTAGPAQATRRVTFRQPGHDLLAGKKKPVIVINVAARLLRGYVGGEKVFECPVVVGRRSYPTVVENTKTRLGSYSIQAWYTDYRTKDYPVPWSRDEWRGAFGIHTAILGPDALYQHIHGTVGPVELADWMITRTPLRDRRPDEREPEYRRYVAGVEYGMSHGCTRVSNENVTRMKELFPVGTEVHKIYALVERFDPADPDAIREIHHPNIYGYEDVKNGVFWPGKGLLTGYHHPEDNYRLGPALPPRDDHEEELVASTPREESVWQQAPDDFRARRSRLLRALRALRGRQPGPSW